MRWPPTYCKVLSKPWLDQKRNQILKNKRRDLVNACRRNGVALPPAWGGGAGWVDGALAAPCDRQVRPGHGLPESGEP